MALEDETFLLRECQHLYVPFEAFHFNKAAVLWLNSRYWCSQDLNLGDPGLVHDLENWLLARFGVSAFGDFDQVDTFRETSVTLYADRYGGTFGHSHGGSGRAGTAGRFNAKGVGATPLTDPNANWYHSHGCMWLEEAIREAIFSEVCWHVFPWRANPIVAIIDTGEHVKSVAGEIGARRVIAVRPAALRLAHLERNILFGSAGTGESDQFLDFLRVKEVVNCVKVNGVDLNGETSSASILSDIMSRVCEQIGYGRAYRLFHGDYLSSNLCISAALVDFGAFRGVADWRRNAWEDNGLPFGGEDRRLFQTARSLSFHFRKHGGDPFENQLMSLDQLSIAIHKAFVSTLTKICGQHSRAGEIVTRLTELYDQQQATPPTQGASWPLFYDGLRGNTSDNYDDVSYRVGSAVRADLSTDPDNALVNVTRNRLLRWAAPFDYASREAVLSRISSAFGANGTNLCHARVYDFIAENVNSIRRTFIASSERELILQQRTVARCLLLTCYDAATGLRHWRIEGPGIGESLLVNGKSRSALPDCHVYDAGEGLIGLRCAYDPIGYLLDANYLAT
ncbi:hypothetical protein [Sphingomonas sp. PAMC 26605]|uniref:hypothetical protein n=1 Tax=Sphingomonas sp. PAMC 26605 TaxID=1112214 RepID=UPI0002D518D9|nr:hypothetical protein [Sphingomonas sp. PAMC 26605]